MATAKGKRRSKRRQPRALLSESSHLERRDERIAYYYFVRRVTKPPIIYDFLIRECRECLGPDTGSIHEARDAKHEFVPLISDNRDSGLRAIQKVVMRLRAEAEPEEILALRRPIETEKVRKTWEYLLQKQIEVLEDNSSITVQKVSPSGTIVSVSEPRCSKLEKGKAAKAAMILAERIGRLTGAQLVAPDETGTGSGRGNPTGDRQFTFNFPNVNGTPDDLSEMIAMNLETGKVN
jgi:hypothetical protein